MRRWALIGVLSLVICIPLVSTSQVESERLGNQTKEPDLNTIVPSLEAAVQQNRTNARGYTVTRRYNLFHDDETKPVSQTTAEVSFVPPATKRYEIKQSSGISRGKQMVRDILDLESVPAQSGSDINRRNYEFIYLQREKLGGVFTYLLRMIPKRKQKTLLNGLIWVDTSTFRIQRIEGTPTKKPSWWIKNLEITLQYADLNGVWLPTYMQARAVVRLAGNYLLTGEDVSLKLSPPADNK